MHYIGGKQKSGGHRIAAYIKAIAEQVNAKEIVEPMCGGLSVTYRLAPRQVSASDACRPLITLYRAAQSGWVPPAEIDRETWEKYRAAPDPEDPMTAFVGFGCSRSGAWFSSYISEQQYSPKHRYPAATAAGRSLLNKLSRCKSVRFAARDYADAPVRGVWYCDIPYKGTLGYPAVGPFDHAQFWAFVTDVSRKIPVVVSEQQAPAPFVAVAEWSVQGRLNVQSGKRRVERLFMHERWVKRTKQMIAQDNRIPRRGALIDKRPSSN